MMKNSFFVAIIGLSCYVSVSIYSYISGNGSYMAPGNYDLIYSGPYNSGGAIGAYISEGMTRYFGYSSFIVSAMMILIGFSGIRGTVSIYKSVALLLSFVTISVVMEWSSVNYNTASSGGYVGEVLLSTIMPVFGELGILSMAMLSVAVIIISSADTKID